MHRPCRYRELLHSGTECQLALCARRHAGECSLRRVRRRHDRPPSVDFFRRALERGNLLVAEAMATELSPLDLTDALEPTILVARKIRLDIRGWTGAS